MRMRRIIHRILIPCLSLLLLSTTLRAQQPGSNSRPAENHSPTDALAPVRSWAGQWQCRGTAFATEQAPARAYAYRLRVTEALLGRWLQFVVPLIPEGKSAPVLEGMDYWGQDPQTGELVEIFLDSTGVYGRGRIDALTATRVHYKGEGAGDASERYYEVTFDLESPGRLRIKYQGSRDGKSWRPRTEDLCRKISRKRRPV